MNRRQRYFLILLMVFTMLIAGCSSESDAEPGQGEDDDTITLRVGWWGGDTRHQMTLDVIDLFEEQHPNIKIEPEYTGWPGYWERINTQAAGSNLPDIVQMDVNTLNEYHSRGVLADLKPFVDDGTINLDNVDPMYNELNVEGDQLLGVSLGANALAMVYNESLFEEHDIDLPPGYTFDDLQDELLKLKSELGDNFYGYDLADADYEQFYVYARQHGQSFYNEEGTGVGFDQDVATEFFTMIQSYLEEGITVPPDIQAEVTDLSEAYTGRRMAALQIAASNQVVAISNGTEDDVGLMLLPALGDQHGSWIRPSMSFSITQHSEHQEAAATFIDFFTNNIEAHEIMQAERGVPVSSDIREALYDQLSDDVQAQFNYLDLLEDYSAPADPPPPPGSTEARDVFMRIIEELKYGMVTPEDAAKRLIEDVNEIIE
ncbi:extracellular solute-binding protein [Caldalkalibacillus salinus]|uniref:extracellular solute-binding protein n=1 Tax=Caldalkalibacillus salinus TaxID=2803787 RepID=UPI001923EE4A